MDFKDAQIRRMKLEELCPAEYNPRDISEKAFGGLSTSIRKFGLLIPVVWNERTGNIVGGHQRFRYLSEEGETETDVVVVDLDPQDEVALNITLNSKEIRGQFTEEAIAMLKMTEAKIGSTFNELAMVELHDALVKNLKPKPKPKDKTSDQPDGDYPDGGSPTGSSVTAEQIAVLTCPKCKSRWRMSDNAVLHNGTEANDE